jgi:hypothetical protein
VAQFNLLKIFIAKLPNADQGMGEPKFGLPMMGRHVKRK